MAHALAVVLFVLACSAPDEVRSRWNTDLGGRVAAEAPAPDTDVPPPFADLCRIDIVPVEAPSERSPPYHTFSLLPLERTFRVRDSCAVTGNRMDPTMLSSYGVFRQSRAGLYGGLIAQRDQVLSDPAFAAAIVDDLDPLGVPDAPNGGVYAREAPR